MEAKRRLMEPLKLSTHYVLVDLSGFGASSVASEHPRPPDQRRIRSLRFDHG